MRARAIVQGAILYMDAAGERHHIPEGAQLRIKSEPVWLSTGGFSRRYRVSWKPPGSRAVELLWSEEQLNGYRARALRNLLEEVP